MPFSPLAITNKEMIIILIILFSAASVLYAMFTMFLSGWVKNGVAAMGMMIGIAFSVFKAAYTIPYEQRLWSQLFSMEPMTLISPLFGQEYRLVRLGGQYLMSWQVAPFVYIGICLVLLFAGERMYNRY